MGLVKTYMLERHHEEMDGSTLSWAMIKLVLRFLIATEGADATWFGVVERFDRHTGDAPCGATWSEVRQVLHNLGTLYFCDTLHDLYGQIAHMSDRYDSLSAKIEQHREDEEFEELLSRENS